MDAGGTDAPATPAPGPAPHGSAAHPQRAAVCGQSRVPVAATAQRVPGVADGLPCLPQMGAGPPLGGAHRPAPGLGAVPGRQMPKAHGSRPGQPEREIRPARRSALAPEHCSPASYLGPPGRGSCGSTAATPAIAFAVWVRGLRPKLAVTVIKRPDEAGGFTILACCSVVGRAFGRLMRLRRLVHDNGTCTASAEAFVLLAMMNIPIQRLG